MYGLILLNNPCLLYTSLGAPIEEEDIPKLIGFLKKQEANGKFFSKAMQKETNTDMEEV